jgi:hypothetical protein
MPLGGLPGYRRKQRPLLIHRRDRTIGGEHERRQRQLVEHAGQLTLAREAIFLGAGRAFVPGAHIKARSAAGPDGRRAGIGERDVSTMPKARRTAGPYSSPGAGIWNRRGQGRENAAARAWS